MKPLILILALTALASVLSFGLVGPAPLGPQSADARHSARKVRAVERKTLRCINRQRTRAASRR